MTTTQTARETTLGALTAADLGKRVRVGGDGQAPWEHTLAGIVHRIDKYMPQNTTVVVSPDERMFMGYVTTPVTVYDEEEA